MSTAAQLMATPTDRGGRQGGQPLGLVHGRGQPRQCRTRPPPSRAPPGPAQPPARAQRSRAAAGTAPAQGRVGHRAAWNKGSQTGASRGLAPDEQQLLGSEGLDDCSSLLVGSLAAGSRQQAEAGARDAEAGGTSRASQRSQARRYSALATTCTQHTGWGTQEVAPEPRLCCTGGSDSVLDLAIGLGIELRHTAVAGETGGAGACTPGTCSTPCG